MLKATGNLEFLNFKPFIYKVFDKTTLIRLNCADLLAPSLHKNITITLSVGTYRLEQAACISSKSTVCLSSSRFLINQQVVK